MLKISGRHMFTVTEHLCFNRFTPSEVYIWKYGGITKKTLIKKNQGNFISKVE